MASTELRKATQLAWRKHLISEYGIEGLLVLREMTPTVGVGDSHNIIFQAGKVEGYRMAIDALQSIIASEEKKDNSIENP